MYRSSSQDTRTPHGDQSRGLDDHFDVEDLEHVSYADKLLETRSAIEALARVKRFPRLIEAPAASGRSRSQSFTSMSQNGTFLQILG